MAPRSDILYNSKPRNTILPEHQKLLDPAYLNLYNAHIPGTTLEHQVPLETYRSDPAKYTSTIPPLSITPLPTIGLEEDVVIPVSNPEGSITLKFYRPKDHKDRKTGVYIHFHGGGWTLGAVGKAEGWCKSLVDRLGVTVVDVDYRLAPEYKYPVAVEDGWGAVEYIYKNADSLGLDKSTILLGGVSAGSHIAIYVTHRARDAGIKIKYAVLVVPVCDASVIDEEFQLKDDCPYPSYHLFHDGPFLSFHRMSYFYRHFLPSNPTPELLREPALSPMHAKSFKDLPPCMIITAEVDVLRDEGKAYTDKLKEAGVEVEYKMFEGVPHPFVGQDCRQSREMVGMVLRRLEAVIGKDQSKE